MLLLNATHFTQTHTHTDGLKKASTEEWEHQEKNNQDNITELKKSVKLLTNRLTYFNNVGDRKAAKESVEVCRKVPYPPGARTAKQAHDIYDLAITNLTKQSDLLTARFQQRKEHFYKLYDEHQSLLEMQPEGIDSVLDQAPPQTVDEDANRKLIWHLENEIHRTNVQWTEAEHIRKKYKSIRASLMIDAEKFEKSLLGLEEAFRKQQTEINRMQVGSGTTRMLRQFVRLLAALIFANLKLFPGTAW